MANGSQFIQNWNIEQAAAKKNNGNNASAISSLNKLIMHALSSNAASMPANFNPTTRSAQIFQPRNF